MSKIGLLPGEFTGGKLPTVPGQAARTMTLNYEPTFLAEDDEIPITAGYPFILGLLAEEYSDTLSDDNNVNLLTSDKFEDLDDNTPIGVKTDSW